MATKILRTAKRKAIPAVSKPTLLPVPMAELTPEEERIRREAKAALIAETLDMAPAAIGYFLNLTYKRVWHLLGSGSDWLPKISELQGIFDFVRLVRAARAGAAVLVELRDKLLTMPGDAGRMFFPPAVWTALKTGGTPGDKRRSQLAVKALTTFKERCEARAKEA